MPAVIVFKKPSSSTPASSVKESARAQLRSRLDAHLRRAGQDGQNKKTGEEKIWGVDTLRQDHDDDGGQQHHRSLLVGDPVVLMVSPPFLIAALSHIIKN